MAKMSLIKDSYGDILYVDMGEDVSTNTSLNMVIQPQFGEKLERTPTVGSSTITVNDEVYTANEYLQYTTVEGDISKKGKYRLQGIVQISATSKALSNYKTIEVK